ncbi:MAG: hypothetical protein IPF82_00980 [Blastocatellia bacterium]|nr:hypothetical protein [Blastocatellia bacterium]
MITDTVLQASKRDERGKNAARRLRAAGRLPVSLYGEGQEAVPVSINTRELGAILRSEAGRGAIFTLAVEGGESTPVKIHTLDLDPVSNPSSPHGSSEALDDEHDARERVDRLRRDSARCPGCRAACSKRTSTRSKSSACREIFRRASRSTSRS